jgi:hypothetical protein
MSEQDNDGFYWEPEPEAPLRQGDLLFNVPIALMPQAPRFVLGSGDEVATQTFPDYPENVPSDQIVVEAVFGALGMIVTPTCHVSEGEKDEDVIAIVPVQPFNLIIPKLQEAVMHWRARTCRYMSSRCLAPSWERGSSRSTVLRC